MLADIDMVRTENEVVNLMIPSFSKQFLDDIYKKRNKFKKDILFEASNSFYINMTLPVEINVKEFFVTKPDSNSTAPTQVYQKENKAPNRWISNRAKRYKQNTISSDLRRSNK